MNRNPSANFGMALIQLVIFSLLSLGLLVVALWSLQQTMAFCIAITNPMVGPFLGFAIQFGQNLCLFMCHRTSSRLEKAGWIAGFSFCALVDAATNMGQWNKEHAGETDLFALVTGNAACAAVVFVEEVMAPAIAANLHYLNETIRSVTGRSIPTLEWAAQTAQQFGPRGHPQPQAHP